MNLRTWILAFALCILASPAGAQDFNKYREKALKDFNAYKKQKADDFNSYREQKIAQMEEYIRKAWERMPGNAPEPVPINEDKDIPPVVMPEEDRGKKPQDTPVPIKEVTPPVKPEPEPEPLAPIQEVPVSNTVSFSLYGTACTVRVDKDACPHLGSSKEGGVADMWKALCQDRFNNLYVDCMAIRTNLNLCDWAYFKLAEAASEAIYTDASERVILQTSILLQSGYRVIMARDDAGRIHNLISSDVGIFGRPFWTIEGDAYYLFDNSGAEKMAVMTKVPKELKPMRLSMSAENGFSPKPSLKRELQSRKYPAARASVSSNVNLISFYDGYPESYANNDPTTRWRFYAQVPLSQCAREGLYSPLKKAVAGLDEADAVSVLLNFVQTAFVYEYDDKVWGRDRAFFADETLYYPYCDCEDRSILLSRLVRDLLGLDVVLVYYPGHLYTAVRFNQDVSGDYLNVDGRKYVVCDPTYIGAPIGLTMPGMDNSGATVIKLQ